MAIFIRAAPLIWSAGYASISRVKAQTIHVNTDLSCWFIIKNFQPFKKPFVEKSKFRVGVMQKNKH